MNEPIKSLIVLDKTKFLALLKHVETHLEQAVQDCRNIEEERSCKKVLEDVRAHINDIKQ